MFAKLEIFSKCAELAAQQRQFYRLLSFYKERQISLPVLAECFYAFPSTAVGGAIFETGEVPIGEMLVNLVTRGKIKEAQDFFTDFDSDAQNRLILEDERTGEAEWNFLLAHLNEDHLRSKIISQRAIRNAIDDENANQRSEFDFYT